MLGQRRRRWTNINPALSQLSQLHFTKFIQLFSLHILFRHYQNKIYLVRWGAIVKQNPIHVVRLTKNTDWAGLMNAWDETFFIIIMCLRYYVSYFNDLFSIIVK